MSFLDKIIATKKKEVNDLKKHTSLRHTQEKCLNFLKKQETKGDKRSLKEQILNARTIGLIAEVKLASPSKGKLTDHTFQEIAGIYAQSHADAISVLTDKKYFNGNIDYLKQMRSLTSKPVFRKDFIIDSYQVYETLLALGDAFLLIAAILSTAELKEFLLLGKQIGLESIVEVHNEEDLEKALNAKADIIGINNRNLETFNIDLVTTKRLLKHIPKGKITISESGINTPGEVQDMFSLGVNGILVGTSILKSDNLLKKIDELKGIG